MASKYFHHNLVILCELLPIIAIQIGLVGAIVHCNLNPEVQNIFSCKQISTEIDFA